MDLKQNILIKIQSKKDGVTVIINRKDRRLLYDICKEWEKITKLELEYVAYDKMILRDVNNYISISTKGKVKRKGVFVLHEEMRENGDWHKAFNQGVVPIALSEYFLNNKPIEETVRNHTNIYDFCKTFSVKGKFISETYELDENNNEINIKEGYKTNRYYPSTDGIRFRKRGEPLKPKVNKRLVYQTQSDQVRFIEIKQLLDLKLKESVNSGEINESIEAKINFKCPDLDYKLFQKYFKYLNYIFNVSRVEYTRGESLEIECQKDWRLIDIENETNVTIFNKFENKLIEDYNINYEFVISECNKVIDTITGKRERELNQRKLEKENERLKREENLFIQFCINKVPTSKQFEEYGKEWLITKYGIPKEIKPSKLKNKEENINE